MSIERRFSIVVERQRYRPVELVFLVTRHVVVVSLSPEKERVCTYVCVREKINRQEEIFISLLLYIFLSPFLVTAGSPSKAILAFLGSMAEEKDKPSVPSNSLTSSLSAL